MSNALFRKHFIYQCVEFLPRICILQMADGSSVVVQIITTIADTPFYPTTSESPILILTYISHITNKTALRVQYSGQSPGFSANFHIRPDVGFSIYKPIELCINRKASGLALICLVPGWRGAVETFRAYSLGNFYYIGRHGNRMYRQCAMVAAGVLAGLISRRSWVRIPLAQPSSGPAISIVAGLFLLDLLEQFC